MKDRVQKDLKRGLRRIRSPRGNRQARLLREIIYAYGGLGSFIDRINNGSDGEYEFKKAAVNNWAMRGVVPLKYCMRIGKILGLPPEALNYNAVSRFRGKAVEWEDMVWKLPLKEVTKAKLAGLVR